MSARIRQHRASLGGGRLFSWMWHRNPLPIDFNGARQRQPNVADDPPVVPPVVPDLLGIRPRIAKPGIVAWPKRLSI